jgi:hypothetical protein
MRRTVIRQASGLQLGSHLDETTFARSLHYRGLASEATWGRATREGIARGNSENPPSESKDSVTNGYSSNGFRLGKELPGSHYAGY